MPLSDSVTEYFLANLTAFDETGFYQSPECIPRGPFHPQPIRGWFYICVLLPYTKADSDDFLKVFDNPHAVS